MRYVCSSSKGVLYQSGILILFLSLPACTHRSEYLRKKVMLPCPKKLAVRTEQPTQPANITIWIHGTRFFKQPYYYTYFEGKPSLRSALELDKKYHLRRVADNLNMQAFDEFCLDTFYLFGWSGKLSAADRKKAAQALYDNIIMVKNEYVQKYQREPAINLVCHSHGGNVALNLAKIARKRLDDAFRIDKLILLACPVQDGTMHYVKDPLFKKIYAIHSSLDLVQIIAPQVTYRVADNQQRTTYRRFKLPPFSQRYFPEHENLAQIKLKLNGRALMHQEFIGKKFLSLLPAMIPVIDTWQMQTTTDHHRKLLSVRVEKNRVNRGLKLASRRAATQHCA